MSRATLEAYLQDALNALSDTPEALTLNAPKVAAETTEEAPQTPRGPETRPASVTNASVHEDETDTQSESGGADEDEAVSATDGESVIPEPVVHIPECLACGEQCNEVLVRCLDCQECFCRSAPEEATLTASHWAHHRGHSKHKQACLYPSSDREWVLQCAYCKQERALDQLGFFTPAVWNAQGQTPLACRACAVQPKPQRQHSSQSWTPLLCRDSDEFHAEFLGGAPPHPCEQPDKRQPSAAAMERLELDLEHRATRKQIAETVRNTTLPAIPSRFDSPQAMRADFCVVLDAESEAQKENDANSAIPHCPGDVCYRNYSWAVELTLVTAGSLTKLSEVIVVFETAFDLNNAPLVWEGYVESIALAISDGFESDTCYRCTIIVTKTLGGFPQSRTGHLFSVANKYAGVSFARMDAVLERMTKADVMDTSLLQTLLGIHEGTTLLADGDDNEVASAESTTPPPEEVPAKTSGNKSKSKSWKQLVKQSAGKPMGKAAPKPVAKLDEKPAKKRVFPPKIGYEQLNKFQKNAVHHAIKHRLTLIQGPPGTGKTSTCGVIVALLQHLTPGKVMVCAGSNTAVDHLAARLIKTQNEGGMADVNILRVEAYSIQGNCSAEVLPHSLYQRTNRIIESLRADHELRVLHTRRQDGDNDWEKVKARYEALRRAVEMRVLRAADIVCCTCITAGNRLFLEADLQFPKVLMDEACQMLEPETWIPLQHGAKQLVLVGDQCQLEPMVRLRKAKDAGLVRSLFERLLQTHVVESLMLAKQYRMHPAIAEFPSKEFYNDKLANGLTAADRTPAEQPFDWPNVDVPIVFIHADKTPDERGPLGLSFRNRDEAAIVVQVVCQLLQSGTQPQDIGIISPYKAQCEYISSRIARHPTLGLDVANCIESSSVDKFQGREKKYIIHSCVRCNDERDIGFMYDPRRLNVSITRAQYGLIFVGDARTLWHATIHSPAQRKRVSTQWCPLLRRFADTHTLVRQVAGQLVPFTPSFLADAQA